MGLIPFQVAYDLVMNHPADLGTEEVPLMESVGRLLAAEIQADRDLPPYDRVTMDGIAIRYASLEQGRSGFRVAGEARAGSPQQELKDPDTCLEVMTGAILPVGADTVIRYEDLRMEKGYAEVVGKVKQGQSLHPQGSDARKGALLMAPGSVIGPAEIAVLASVGRVFMPVCKVPETVVISTGDELVDVSATPLPHQIRRSNVHALAAALQGLGIHPRMEHLSDDPREIRKGLGRALETAQVLMLSGGVSMGKYDFLPEILGQLGVEKLFHRVAQRPGKPFWFGVHPGGCRVFSFPGNPVSTFLNYHLYFRHWLFKSWGLNLTMPLLPISSTLKNPTGLTHFHLGKVSLDGGTAVVRPIPMNSSGDFVSLTRADGFIVLDPGVASFRAGQPCPFLFYKSPVP